MSVVYCSCHGRHLSPVPIAPQERGVQQASGTTPGPAPSGDQDSGDTHDLVRSGGPRGKSRVLVTPQSLLTIASEGEMSGRAGSW